VKEKSGGILPWVENNPDKEKVVTVELDKIAPNPYQPRRTFEEDKIEELSQSIQTYGLLQPVIVRKTGRDAYQLVVGERRVIACRRLGMNKIPAVIKELSDNAVATIALIENLQRENLDFIEEARGYERLINEFNFTQEVLAQRLGKSQSTIANKLRLLKLPDKVIQLLTNGDLTERHARALLKLNSADEQEKLVEEIIQKDLNVKDTENRVEEILSDAQEDKGKGKSKKGKASKGVVRDLRIYLNTIRQAIFMVKKSGLTPLVEENDGDEYYEISIKLPKKVEEKSKNVINE